MDEVASPGSTHDDPQLAAAIVENAFAYAIFTLDAHGVILTWSPGAEAIIGYRAAEAIGMNFSVVFTESDRAAGINSLELETVRTDGRAEDSRWHLRRDGERFWANGVAMRLDGPGQVASLKILRDETPLKVAEDNRILLLNELNHRIKNTLATVQAIAEQTLRAGDVDRQTRENLGGRLMALSDAHNVLVDENWAGADLEAIVAQALTPYQIPGRVLSIDGPPVRLSPQQAVAMALALHELATNAVKYGALSIPAGAVHVSWNASYDATGARHMTFLWDEAGGPVVQPPGRSGFGSRLLERTFGRENGGRARLDFRPAGLRCAIELPLTVPGEVDKMLDIAGAS
jgi:PAS domain S-box-containing protein